MGGIFGGLLAVIQILGGIFLFLLVGSKAWKPRESAELFRTTFGGAILGILVAIGLDLFQLIGPLKKAMPLWFLIFAGMLGGICFSFVLYGIHRALVGPTQD